MCFTFPGIKIDNFKRHLITRHLTYEIGGEFMTPATQFQPIRCYHRLFFCVKTYYICTDSLRITHDGYPLFCMVVFLLA